MKRMSTSNVLIVGLDGLGIEIGAWLSPIPASAEADRLCSEKRRPCRCQILNHFRPSASDGQRSRHAGSPSFLTYRGNVWDLINF